MKTIKKMIVLTLTLMMCLTMGSLSVFAAETDPYDNPLTITGLTTNDEVHFYKVLEWAPDDADSVKGWKAVEPFDTVLTKAKLTEVLLGNAEATPPVTPGITAELAGELAKQASGDGTVVTVTGTEAELANTEAGLWMGLITPADVDTVYNPVFVAADFNKDNSGDVAVSEAATYSDTAAAKKSTLTLEKTASTDEDEWDDGESYTTAVGDTVSFTVTTTIPGYGTVYENPHFAMKDKLTAMELVANSVAVTGLEKGKDYTVQEGTDSYTITFTKSYLQSLSTPTEITVTYSATVTSDAAYAVNEEDNEVYIEYSHDPTAETDYDVKKDTTQHYTFSIDAEGAGSGENVNGKKTSEVVKIGVDAAGNPINETTETSEITSTETWEGPLQGAVFGLFTDEAGNTPYTDKDGNDVTATTGGDGRMNFAGLDAGTYYLKEISAPAGFVKDQTVHSVVISAEVETVTVTEWWNGTEWVSTKPTSGTAKEVTYETEVLKKYTVKIDGEETATYTFTNPEETNSNKINWETAELVEHPFQIENTQGTELPSTGGIGTIIFYVLGTILVVGSAIILISRRRIQSR